MGFVGAKVWDVEFRLSKLWVVPGSVRTGRLRDINGSVAKPHDIY